MTPVIEVSDVWATRQHMPVLRAVSLAVARGEVVALVGPSGAGKSSLLRVVLGLLVPERGRVELRGEIASHDGTLRLLPEARNLGMMFQDLALWPHMTVAGNLAFGLAARGLPKSEREGRVETWLRRVGMHDKAARRPGDLSGGEQQRVAVARALVLEPDAVLLDEPLAHLDVVLRRDLLVLFRALFREQAVATLYVTHEPRDVRHLADRVAVMQGGRLAQAGSLEELRAHPADDFVHALLDDLA